MSHKLCLRAYRAVRKYYIFLNNYFDPFVYYIQSFTKQISALGVTGPLFLATSYVIFIMFLRNILEMH